MLVIPELRMLQLEDKKLQASLIHGGTLSQTIKSWGYSSIARVQSLTPQKFNKGLFPNPSCLQGEGEGWGMIMNMKARF